MDITNILFRSKIRRKILMRFFADEGKRYYINELARLVATTQGTCRRELNRLVETGIFTSSREGNLQYYTVNKNHPLMKEFRSIIRKTIGIEASLCSVLGDMNGVEFAFIFGSYATGGFSTESDIDLAVIGNIPDVKLVRELKRIEKETGRAVNYHLFDKEDFKAKIRTNSFVQNILANFILLKGNQGEFRRLLEGT